MMPCPGGRELCICGHHHGMHDTDRGCMHGYSDGHNCVCRAFVSQDTLEAEKPTTSEAWSAAAAQHEHAGRLESAAWCRERAATLRVEAARLEPDLCFCERCELNRWETLRDHVATLSSRATDGELELAAQQCASARDGRHPFGIAQRLSEAIDDLRTGLLVSAQETLESLAEDERKVIENGDTAPCSKEADDV